MKKICLLLLATTTTLLFGQVDGSLLFNDNFLHEIRFENADTNFFIATKDYQQLKMTVDGTVVDSVGFKRKGNISGYPSTNKYGIKIKTNKYVMGKEYDGIKEFTLHMNYQDPSMMREKLTYDICAEMGLFSLRTAFAKVYINEQYWGLYTLVEGKDEMYKQVFDNRDMDAIESLDFGGMCYLSDNPVDYDVDNNGGEPYYQLENGNAATAWPRFAQMIDKANNTPNAQYVDTVSTYLNLTDFFTYQAVNVYLLNMDSYIRFKGNQIYVYDENVGRWEVTPWDFNASIGLWDTDFASPSTYPLIPNAINTGCIASKMNDIDAFRITYLNSMCLLSNVAADTLTMFNKIDFWYNQIRDAVYADTRKVVTNSNFDASVGEGTLALFGENIPALKHFFRARFLFIQDALADEGYDCESIGLAVEENKTTDKVTIYPNPTADLLNLNGVTTGTLVQVFNLHGKLMHESVAANQLIVRDWPAGMYLLRITSASDKTQTIRFVKHE